MANFPLSPVSRILQLLLVGAAPLEMTQRSKAKLRPCHAAATHNREQRKVVGLASLAELIKSGGTRNAYGAQYCRSRVRCLVAGLSGFETL